LTYLAIGAPSPRTECVRLRQSNRCTTKQKLHLGVLDNWSCTHCSYVLVRSCMYLVFAVTVTPAIGVARGGMPPRFLAYLVILCFERRYPKQNIVASLKSKDLTLQTFWSCNATYSRMGNEVMGHSHRRSQGGQRGHAPHQIFRKYSHFVL